MKTAADTVPNSKRDCAYLRRYHSWFLQKRQMRNEIIILSNFSEITFTLRAELAPDSLGISGVSQPLAVARGERGGI